MEDRGEFSNWSCWCFRPERDKQTPAVNEVGGAGHRHGCSLVVGGLMFTISFFKRNDESIFSFQMSEFLCWQLILN